MKLLRLATLCVALAVLALAAPALAASAADTTLTTVILIRHAERDTVLVGPDPPLSVAGFRRAQELRRVVGETGIDVIYSTPFQRNRQTSGPVAQTLGLQDSVRIVEGPDMEKLAKRIRSEDRGKTVLFVGHSDTLPRMLEALTGRKPDPVQHWEYDVLYVVSLQPKGPPGVTKLRYGERTGPH